MEGVELRPFTEHLDDAFERLPGPGYYRVLRWIHRFVKPANYVEIGVQRAVSLVQAVPGTRVIGIDPEPRIEEPFRNEIERKFPAASIYEMTSDDFFARRDLGELLGGPVALAFIDGLHLFEQVLRDFVNIERYADGRTLVLLHDCIPFDEVTSSRERTTEFYSGDVWKAALALRRIRPELRMVTVRTAPTGLCLVHGLGSESGELERRLPEIEGAYRDLDFAYYQAHRDEMPPEIPNEVKAVGDWLREGRLA